MFVLILRLLPQSPQLGRSDLAERGARMRAFRKLAVLVALIAFSATSAATAQEELSQEWQDMLVCMAPSYINGVHFTVSLPHFQATDRVKDYAAFAAKFMECKKQILARRQTAAKQ